MTSTKNNENKLRKKFISISEKPLNILTTNFLKTNMTDLINGLSINIFDFSKYIVCFDDLERCQIDVKEVLGFINNFVEHRYLKTIILANEPEITNSKIEDQSKERNKPEEEDQLKEDKVYYQIKEKVIGRDLKFEFDISTTLPKLFGKYIDPDFTNFLTKQQIAITEILIEYKQDNLRTISFLLDTLERIFPTLKNVQESYVQEIIFFSAIITIEYKNGALTSDDYRNFKNIDNINKMTYSFYLSRKTSESEEEKSNEVKTYPDIFFEKYLINRHYSYSFYPSIYSYVLSGYFDQARLENEIQIRKSEIISKEVQCFRTLHMFRELSEDDFKRLTKDVLQYAKEGKYIIYNYITIADFFYYFAEKELIAESKKEIEKLLFEGLEIAKGRKEIDESTFESLLHFGVKNPDVSVIANKVIEIHDNIKKEQYVANSNKLIDFLNKDEAELRAFFEKHILSKELFPYINGDILLDTILKNSNKQIFYFKELLKDRYNSSNIGEFLYEDIDCLKKLQEGLSKHLENNKEIKPLRKFSYNELISTLKDNIKHLDETRRK